MLQFMLFCFCITFVTMMSGLIEVAIFFGLLFFATPFVCILWEYVLFPKKY